MFKSRALKAIPYLVVGPQLLSPAPVAYSVK